jgi:hypothetical protein
MGRNRERRCSVCRKAIKVSDRFWYRINLLGDEVRWHVECDPGAPS